MKMREVEYKVLRNGLIAAFQDRRQLSSLALNEAPSLLARKDLRVGLDRDVLRATVAMFGRKWVPADYNEVHANERLVKRLAADRVEKLITLIEPFVRNRMLQATPQATVVKRLKKVLTREGFVPHRRGINGGYVSDPSRAKTDVNEFWKYYERDIPLTEAGWRFLCKQSSTLLREVGARPWQLRDKLWLFNQLPTVGVETLSFPEFERLEQLNLNRYLKDTASLRNFLLAWRDAEHRTSIDFYGDTAFYQQCDVIREWLADSEPVLQSGVTWQSLLTRALQFAAEQGELEKSAVSDLRWAPAIAPFVTADGLVVTALENGAQLLEEGQQMQNCLLWTRGYAEEGVKGRSQIFRIQGVAGRATVQFVKKQTGWVLGQAEEYGNTPVSNPAVRRAIDQLKTCMEVRVWEREVR
jgi:hypothetical protein